MVCSTKSHKRLAASRQNFPTSNPISTLSDIVMEVENGLASWDDQCPTKRVKTSVPRRNIKEYPIPTFPECPYVFKKPFQKRKASENQNTAVLVAEHSSVSQNAESAFLDPGPLQFRPAI